MRALALLLAAAFVFAVALPAGAAESPRKEKARLKRQVAALQAKVRRLEAEQKLLVQSERRALRRQQALARRVAAVDPCPITHANGSQPPGSTFGAEFHGNGSLWVGLPSSNVVVAEPGGDGSISDKFGWWRAVSGRLAIEGRRLDGPAPPLRASVPDGYGETGFQSSALIFPAPGCWEVTGRVGGAELTFVTLALAS
jgi:hypothetical protein